MSTIILSFLAGMAFFLGIILGMTVYAMASKEERKRIKEDFKAANNEVINRLSKQVLIQERIAVALETYSSVHGKGEAK